MVTFNKDNYLKPNKGSLLRINLRRFYGSSKCSLKTCSALHFNVTHMCCLNTIQLNRTPHCAMICLY